MPTLFFYLGIIFLYSTEKENTHSFCPFNGLHHARRPQTLTETFTPDITSPKSDLTICRANFLV